jgi:hypothetical protein
MEPIAEGLASRRQSAGLIAEREGMHPTPLGLRPRQLYGQPQSFGQAVADGFEPGTTVALLEALAVGDDTAIFDRSAETARCLLLLVKVARTVTDELSLDHQLPRLIELIVAGLCSCP